MIFNKKEREIKREILARATALAREQYEKEVMFDYLQTSDLNYTIIEDLIKAANLTGSVEIKMKDGAVITIKSDPVKEQLNNKADLF